VLLRDVDLDGVVLFAQPKKNSDRRMNVTLFEQSLNECLADLLL
jgi:hypothetical protein